MTTVGCDVFSRGCLWGWPLNKWSINDPPVCRKIRATNAKRREREEALMKCASCRCPKRNRRKEEPHYHWGCAQLEHPSRRERAITRRRNWWLQIFESRTRDLRITTGEDCQTYATTWKGQFGEVNRGTCIPSRENDLRVAFNLLITVPSFYSHCFRRPFCPSAARFGTANPSAQFVT